MHYCFCWWWIGFNLCLSMVSWPLQQWLGRANVGACVGVGKPKWTQVDPSGLRWTQVDPGLWWWVASPHQVEIWLKEYEQYCIDFPGGWRRGRRVDLLSTLMLMLGTLSLTKLPFVLCYLTQWVDVDNNFRPQSSLIIGFEYALCKFWPGFNKRAPITLFTVIHSV